MSIVLHNFSPQTLFVIPMPRHPSLRLAQQSCCNIPHVCLLELVVLSIVSVDVDEFEGLNHAVDIKAHVHESVDKILVISLVSIRTSVSGGIINE